MARVIAGTILGILVAWLTIVMMEFISVTMFPPTPGLQMSNPQDIAKLVASAPMEAMLVVLAGWVMGAFDGGIVAGVIARQRARIPALIIGTVVMLGVVAMIRMVPHPQWMSVLGVLLPVPMAWVGAKLAQVLLSRQPNDARNGGT